MNFEISFHCATASISRDILRQLTNDKLAALTRSDNGDDAELERLDLDRPADGPARCVHFAVFPHVRHAAEGLLGHDAHQPVRVDHVVLKITCHYSSSTSLVFLSLTLLGQSLFLIFMRRKSTQRDSMRVTFPGMLALELPFCQGLREALPLEAILDRSGRVMLGHFVVTDCVRTNDFFQVLTYIL